jgi:hypothetical protein
LCQGTDLGNGTKKNSAALNFPKNTEASIILKWKKFGTTKTHPRAGCPAKLNNRGRRVMVRDVAKNPDVHSDRALEFLCSFPPMRPLWWSGQAEATPQ